jgi:hypothetical protein
MVRTANQWSDSIEIDLTEAVSPQAILTIVRRAGWIAVYHGED